MKSALKSIEEGDFSAAEALLSDLLLHDPELVEALFFRAYSRLRQLRNDEALQDAQKCVQLRPENGIFWMLQGEIHLEKSDYVTAHQDLRRACELEPDNGRALFWMGKASLKIGRRHEASDYFERALQFERDYVMSQWMAEQLQ